MFSLLVIAVVGGFEVSDEPFSSVPACVVGGSGSEPDITLLQDSTRV